MITNEDIKIVLVSMVKNEEKIIERMMQSVIEYIDGYIICDTGSTDNTVSVANNFITANNKPGVVIEIPWINFGESRTRTMNEAFKWVTKQGWDNYNTWGLLLDADMILPDAIDKKILKEVRENLISLNQKNRVIMYKNTRLLRMYKEWKCIGSTHEFWEPEICSAVMENPVIYDLNDGGCKLDKFKRDIKYLKQDLGEKPDDDRSLFYLGQTYQSTKKYKKSNYFLKKRIRKGGWKEEIYMCHIYRGNNYMAMKKKKKAVYEWIKAWNIERTRTEGAISIISHYRSIKGMEQTAMMFIEKLIAMQLGEDLMGVSIGEKIQSNCVLFVSHSNLKFDIWRELSLVAFYTGHFKEAWSRLDEKIISSDLSFNERNELLGFQRWYEWFIKKNKNTKIELESKLLPWKYEENSDVWKSFNPSIRQNKNYYDVVLRYSNYSTVDSAEYITRGSDKIISTRNVVLKLNSKFKPVCVPKELIIDEKYIVKEDDTLVRGVEDCRLINNSTLFFVLSNSIRYTESDTRKVNMIYWSDENEKKLKNTINVNFKKMKLPEGIPEKDCQKNWLPFMHECKSYFIFSIYPFIVCDMKSNKIIEWMPHCDKFTLKGLRGSTAPIYFNSSRPEEIFIMSVHYCHFSIFNNKNKRRYYNRFITLDVNFTPVRLSGGFKLSNSDIEYVSGMCKSIKDNDTYNISYGINDCESHVANIDKGVIESILWYELNTGVIDVVSRLGCLSSIIKCSV